jgi:hypothetical protein
LGGSYPLCTCTIEGGSSDAKFATPRGTLEAQDQRFKEDYMARLAKEREERESITKASVEADEDDPYGGW